MLGSSSLIAHYLTPFTWADIQSTYQINIKITFGDSQDYFLPQMPPHLKSSGFPLQLKVQSIASKVNIADGFGISRLCPQDRTVKNCILGMQENAKKVGQESELCSHDIA